jgi:transcriptional regulator with PAS, ATPase and Fis domain
LFLEEISEITSELQVKLLKVLQDRTFVPVGSTREMRTSTRVIAATNANLEKLVEEGTFREDLFYRLNVMPIFMPPLRDRASDIPDLVQIFLEKLNLKYKKDIRGLSARADELLRRYSWPGNIRELENVIERAVVIERTNQIQAESLPESVRSDSALPNQDTSILLHTTLDFDQFKEEAEKEFIIRALKSFKGRINKTVAHANIPKNTLLRKIKKYGINVKDFTH